jgi:hypothetical protein
MHKWEIDRKFDEIVAFAETCAERVEASNASSTRRWSATPAGRLWRVRLEFAVAAQRGAAKQLVVSGSMRYDHPAAKQAFEIEA